MEKVFPATIRLFIRNYAKADRQPPRLETKSTSLLKNIKVTNVWEYPLWKEHHTTAQDTNISCENNFFVREK